MRHKIVTLIEGIALAAAWILPGAVALAQDPAPAPLAEQLKAQYQLAKVGGGEVVEKGTVLKIEKGGMLGSPHATMVVCPSRFEGGELRPPSKICAVSLRAASRYFKQGEKVYVTKIEVNPKKDHVSVSIVSCDACNGIDPPTNYRSEVIFEFAKGSLATATVPTITDTIGQVFSIDNSPPPTQQAAGGDAAQPQNPAPDAGAAAAPPEPAHVQLGQTPDQVKAALGQPESIMDLGSKQIYVYKNLKVTFLNGKVNDVQ